MGALPLPAPGTVSETGAPPEKLIRPLIVGLTILLLAGDARWAQTGSTSEEARRQPLLVGAVVRHREVGTLMVQAEAGRYLIPLEPFAQVAGCTVQKEEAATRFITPLGSVDLMPEDLWIDEGTVYLRQAAIESKLATPVSFDSSRFVLVFDLPWRSVTATDVDFEADPLAPDALPPSLSLSTLHSDIRYTRVEEDDYYRTQTSVGGRLGPGYWRLRYDDNLEGRHEVRDYTWLTQQNNKLFLAGNHRVRLHPLLQSLEATGAQFAWTSESLDRFGRSSQPRELLSRRLTPVQSFEGTGPPAGLAELRVDGRVVERQQIGLDGRYEFFDVSVPARRANRVEVLLYDRHDLSTPAEIHELTQMTSEYLLSDGALVLLGGAGVEGNALQESLDSTQTAGGGLGFYQTRWGVSDGLTLEGAIQANSDVTQVMGGFVSRLGNPSVLSLGVGASNGRLGYDIDFDLRQVSWRLLVQSQVIETEFQPGIESGQFEHSVEYGYQWSPNLDTGLVGRSRRISGDRVEYLLPAFTWRPTVRAWVRGAPDIEGDYRFDLSYDIRPGTRLNVATVADRASAHLSQRLTSRHSLRVGTEAGGDRATRHQAIVTGYGSGRFRPTWSAGLLGTGSEVGYLLGGKLEAAPGIYAGMQLESDSRVDDPSEAEERLLFHVTSDIGFSGGRIVAARAASVREDRGGVAGFVSIDAPEGFPRHELGDLPIMVNGKTAGRTNSSGGFFIGDLPPSVYRFELGTENLPIELAPERVAVTAKVGVAAVTRVSFVVRPEFGIAGRVRDASDAPVPGVMVELVHPSGGILKAVPTDRFGLFRLDSVPIGTYNLRLAPDVYPSGSSRQVVVSDDFLFDQDLRLP